MRKIFLAVFLALASAGAMTLPAATPASAQSAVSVSLFYRQLAPHGRWFRHPRWGWAWFPIGVPADWRPYSRGSWQWTDENGWYWVSDEPFGWAVYHYGRWAYDGEYGWIWIPGGTWGPAWVSFRYSDDYIGWAPLPPETLDAPYGWDAVYVDLDADYYVPRWFFVERRYFLDRGVYAHRLDGRRNRDFIRVTATATKYERGRHGVFNRSIDRGRLEAALGRKIGSARINVVGDPRHVGPDRSGLKVNVFRPDVRVSRDLAPPPGLRAKAGDRPRVTIQRDAVTPSDRRAGIRRDAGPAPKQPAALEPSQRGRRLTQPMPGTAAPDKRSRVEHTRPRGPSAMSPSAGPQKAAPHSLPPRNAPDFVRKSPPHVAPSAPPQYRAHPVPAPKAYSAPPRAVPAAPPRAQPPAPKAAPPPPKAPSQKSAPGKPASGQQDDKKSR